MVSNRFCRYAHHERTRDVSVPQRVECRLRVEPGDIDRVCVSPRATELGGNSGGRKCQSWRLREDASSPIQQFDSQVRGCFLGERPLETNDRSLDGGVQGLEEVAKLRRYGPAIQTAGQI
jgi:hypothetical protein